MNDAPDLFAGVPDVPRAAPDTVAVDPPSNLVRIEEGGRFVTVHVDLLREAITGSKSPETQNARRLIRLAIDPKPQEV